MWGRCICTLLREGSVYGGEMRFSVERLTGVGESCPREALTCQLGIRRYEVFSNSNAVLDFQFLEEEGEILFNIMIY